MKFLENFNSFGITFEILDYNYNIPLFENNFNLYSYKDKGRKINIPLNQEQKNKLKNIKKSVDSRLKDINPFIGIYRTENEQIIRRKFEITYNDHWILRFLRKDIEDPSGELGIKEPGVYEGIDLIYDNINTLTGYIFNKILQNNFRVLVKATNREGYELIFDLEKDRLEKKKYRIYFVTQMKGIGHSYKPYNPSEKPINRTIKL
jgi:hypothetical protein